MRQNRTTYNVTGMRFSFLAPAFFGCLTLQTVRAAPSANVNSRGTSSSVISFDQILTWITTTDANLTFIDDPPFAIKPFPKRQEEEVALAVVILCTEQVNDGCSGDCTIHTAGGGFSGGCASVPGTNCILATTDLQFCTGTACTGTCNSLADCGDILSDGFCATPGTNTISFPMAPIIQPPICASGST
ncbi:hypothetical protein BDN72DRAFT_895953 [Pluteus cervinus]|uniref:Uncharacterized protein n=1 Tax=Pluteus cervinus TaxID=181527 RepID=A0ACD3B1J7_9AGAR|nr:hypothetical protein BDN72DRAFT_895953 [Pluteus cervinus]